MFILKPSERVSISTPSKETRNSMDIYSRTLLIRQIKKVDEGTYMCNVSTVDMKTGSAFKTVSVYGMYVFINFIQIFWKRSWY